MRTTQMTAIILMMMKKRKTILLRCVMCTQHVFICALILLSTLHADANNGKRISLFVEMNSRFDIRYQHTIKLVKYDLLEVSIK